LSSARRRSPLGLGVFAVLFVTYAYFHQGGGWNQNGRFAQVRALVETGRFAIDDFLLYQARSTVGGPVLERRPLPPGIPFRRLPRIASSGDLALHPERREIYPIKTPGTVLLAAPAYGAALAAERLLGTSPDRWAALTFNAYWTTLLSVGLSGALLGVLALAASRRLFPELPDRRHLAAALTLGLATLVLPFSTAYFDHVPTALGSFLAFYCALRAREATGATGSDRPALWLLAGGFAAGFAVVANYLAAAIAAIVGGYVFAAVRPRWQTGWYVLGGLPWAGFLGAYHRLAFGSPFTLANLHAHEQFTTEGEILGAFGAPDPEALWRMLVSEHRGLLFTSPVLALALVPGLWWMARKGRRAEAAVVLLAFLSLWLANGAYTFWHGGWSLGPRFLVPSVPFVAVALAPVFDRLPRLAAGAAGVSGLLLFFATAVDMQPPPDFERPFRDYLVPLARGEELKVARATVAGRVSANAIGFYEGWYYTAFPRGSRQARWNSFNLGEALAPGSPASLVPLALFLGGALPLLWRRARDP
jgi:hypothetical protein